MGRLVVLSGPSCVGKSPLHGAITKLYPEWEERLRKLVLFNCRAPRPGERDGVDYFFRTREEIDSFRSRPDMLVMDVRGDLQALSLPELEKTLAASDALFEGNPFVGSALLAAPELARFPRLGVFISPLSRDELAELKRRGVKLDAFVTDVMRRKLLRRTTKFKGILSLPDLNEIERRCGSAFGELRLACRFEWVIPNHDGEDSENWGAFYYPVGDARRTLLTLLALLSGAPAAEAERWETGLLGGSEC
jgi:guanylate kinase